MMSSSIRLSLVGAQVDCTTKRRAHVLFDFDGDLHHRKSDRRLPRQRGGAQVGSNITSETGIHAAGKYQKSGVLACMSVSALRCWCDGKEIWQGGRTRTSHAGNQNPVP